MRKSLLSLFLLFSIIQVNAQEHQWGITFTPAFTGTTSWQYGIQPGAIYKLNERWELLTEFTFIAGLNKDSSTLHPAYFRIKPEIRYIISSPLRKTKCYAGLQLSYSHRKWEDVDGGSYFEEALYEDSSIRYSSAKINSPVYSASAQTGMMIRLGNHFNIDMFMGWGVRVINTTYSDVVNNGKVYNIRPSCMIFIKPDPAYWVNGTITRVHFDTGIRFIYRF
jgi:hypothetical protein